MNANAADRDVVEEAKEEEEEEEEGRPRQSSGQLLVRLSFQAPYCLPVEVNGGSSALEVGMNDGEARLRVEEMGRGGRSRKTEARQRPGPFSFVRQPRPKTTHSHNDRCA